MSDTENNLRETKTPQEISDMVDSAVIFPRAKDNSSWQYFKLGTIAEQQGELDLPRPTDDYKKALGYYLKAIETDTIDIKANNKASFVGDIEYYNAARAVTRLLESKFQDPLMKEIYQGIDYEIVSHGVQNKLYAKESLLLHK